MTTTTSIQLPVVIDDTSELMKHGVCRVPIPMDVDERRKWAAELSQLTPRIMAGEGDGQYAFYRNILDEPDFPFDSILKSEIGVCIQKYFLGETIISQHPQRGEQRPTCLDDVIRLDDAFCVHYNTDQADTTGAKHTDPSDITVNMCLEKSNDTQGSQVLFYGSKALSNVSDNVTQILMGSSPPSPHQQQPKQLPLDPNFNFLVNQLEGYATIHWGNHPHETTELGNGRRTNIVLTYCFRDPTRSDASNRCCYFLN